MADRRWLVAIGGALAIAAFALLAAGLNGRFPSGDDTSGRASLRPNDAAVVELARRVCAENCASCHGAKLEGQANWRERGRDGRLPAPPHDETGHTWRHPDSQLIELTRLGPAKVIGDPRYVSDMPAYADVLTDEQIVAVLSFTKST